MIDPKTDISARIIPVSLSFTDWRKIGAALEDMPFKIAAPLMANINAQINAFVNPPAAEPAPASGPTPEPIAAPAPAAE